jgi:hypothetical protein
MFLDSKFSLSSNGSPAYINVISLTFDDVLTFFIIFSLIFCFSSILVFFASDICSFLALSAFTISFVIFFSGSA